MRSFSRRVEKCNQASTGGIFMEEGPKFVIFFLKIHWRPKSRNRYVYNIRITHMKIYIYIIYIYTYTYALIMDHHSRIPDWQGTNLDKVYSTCFLCFLERFWSKPPPKFFPSKRAAPPVFPLFWTSCASYAWGEKLHSGHSWVGKFRKVHVGKWGVLEPFPPSCLFHF